MDNTPPNTQNDNLNNNNINSDSPSEPADVNLQDNVNPVNISQPQQAQDPALQQAALYDAAQAPQAQSTDTAQASPLTSSTVPPQAPPVSSSQQPMSGGIEQPKDTTDIFGIISLVCAVSGFQLIGVILGIIGMRKAKKEGLNPILSKIGFWINLVLTIFITLVVIFYVAILIFSLSINVNTKARDTERQSDIKAIQSQLESYFAQKGTYPSLSDINNASWRASNMPIIDYETLRDPDGTTAELSPSIEAKKYSYQVYESNGSTVCKVTAMCAKYKLSATLEEQNNGSNIYTKTSLY